MEGALSQKTWQCGIIGGIIGLILNGIFYLYCVGPNAVDGAYCSMMLFYEITPLFVVGGILSELLSSYVWGETLTTIILILVTTIPFVILGVLIGWFVDKRND